MDPSPFIMLVSQLPVQMLPFWNFITLFPIVFVY